MFAEVMGEEAYCAYRIHLEIFLQIPTDASDQNIHQLIEAGFSASSVMALYALGTIPFSTQPDHSAQNPQIKTAARSAADDVRK